MQNWHTICWRRQSYSDHHLNLPSSSRWSPQRKAKRRRKGQHLHNATVRVRASRLQSTKSSNHKRTMRTVVQHLDWRRCIARSAIFNRPRGLRKGNRQVPLRRLSNSKAITVSPNQRAAWNNSITSLPAAVYQASIFRLLTAHWISNSRPNTRCSSKHWSRYESMTNYCFKIPTWSPSSRCCGKVWRAWVKDQ